MKSWKTDKLILKIIALGLAIITWVYVNGELQRKFQPQTKSHLQTKQISN